MRAILFGLLSLVAFECAAQEQGATFDFLGRTISVTEVEPEPCARQSEDGMPFECMQFYSLWDVRYEVIDVLAGSPVGREVTVRFVSHYGLAPFAKYRNAVVRTTYAIDGDDRGWLMKDGFAVFRTRAGGWATCGDPLAPRDEGPSTRMHAIDYAEDLGAAAQFAPRTLDRAYYESRSHYDVVDGRVRCREGVDLADMYAMATGKEARVSTPARPRPSEDTPDGPPYPVRFIGRMTSAEKSPSACSDDKPYPSHLCMQEYDWIAHFTVVEPLSDHPKATEATLRTVYWRGIQYRQVLVVADIGDGGHLEATVVPVFRTRAGGWASCGDPDEAPGEVPPSPRMHAIDFAEDLGEVGQLSDEGVRAAFYDFDGHYDVGDGRVRCREGIDLADLLDATR